MSVGSNMNRDIGTEDNKIQEFVDKRARAHSINSANLCCNISSLSIKSSMSDVFFFENDAYKSLNVLNSLL